MMVVTDLDGTLLDAQHRLTRANRDALERLGDAGAIRVVATGRSLWSARRVLSPDFPIDYLVFASGAGILHWASDELLASHHLPGDLALDAVAVLAARGLDFMLHRGVPENHRFWYRRGAGDNPDFARRLRRYSAFAEPWPEAFPEEVALSQLVAIAPPGDASHERISAALPDLKVIRTTSPLDERSTWIEIFAAPVSKANAAEWIRRRHEGPAPLVLGVGNDWNDIDLLEWAPAAYVVGNAPAALRRRYATVPHHAADGFAEAVRRWLAGI